MAFLRPEDFDSTDIPDAAGLNTNSDKQEQLALMAKLSTALRTKNLPQGQMAGQMYIPANPLDTAMGIYDHLSAIQGAKGLDGKFGSLINDKQSAIERLLQHFHQRQAGQMPFQTDSPQDTLGDLNLPDIGK